MSGLLGDGLRFGYLVAPDPNRRVLESLAMSWGLACAPLLIELARHWLEDGTVVAIQARQAEHARALWQAVARTELKALGSPSTAGWGLWLPARGRRAEDLVSRLRRAGVDAIGSEPFSVAAAHPNALLVRLRLLAGKTSRHWRGRSWMPGPEFSGQAGTRPGRVARQAWRPGRAQEESVPAHRIDLEPLPASGPAACLP